MKCKRKSRKEKDQYSADKTMSWLSDALKLSLHVSPPLCLVNDIKQESTIKTPSGLDDTVATVAVNKPVLRRWKDTRANLGTYLEDACVICCLSSQIRTSNDAT